MSADSNLNRAKWISAQLIAFNRRIKIFSGESSSFDQESKDLFGVVAPVYKDSYYKNVLAKIDSLLPGKGTINDRFPILAKKFIIPYNKLDVVLKAAIAAARSRTLKNLKLPGGESVKVEYVQNKSWTAFNSYQGNYKSVVQINTDLPLNIADAIDIGAHECYPGHHVYNILLENKLFREKGWVEL